MPLNRSDHINRFVVKVEKNGLLGLTRKVVVDKVIDMEPGESFRQLVSEGLSPTLLWIDYESGGGARVSLDSTVHINSGPVAWGIFKARLVVERLNRTESASNMNFAWPGHEKVLEAPMITGSITAKIQRLPGGWPRK